MATRPTLSVSANLRLVTNIDPAQSYYGSYEAFQALYPGNLGSLPIYGVAPQTFASTINIPFYTSPTAAQYATGPGMFIDPSPKLLLGQTISTTVGSGTLTGLSPAYVDADGQSWTTVNWQWVMIADKYQYGTATGFYKQQVIQYTGDGTANRLILTALDLTAGIVTVWITGGDGVTNITNYSCIKHTGLMQAVIYNNAGALTGSEIGAFEATGFRVSLGTTVASNVNLVPYTAVIMQDTTSDNRYLSVGSYTGDGLASHNIAVPGNGIPTHVWVFGRYGAYRSPDFSGALSLTGLGGTTASDPTNTSIIAVGPDSFTVGNYQFVNANLTPYYFAVLKADAAFLAQHNFVSFTAVGAVSAPTVVSGLGFTPAAVFAKRYNSPNTSILQYRGLGYPNTGSIQVVDSATATQNLVAIGSGTVSLGTTLAPTGETVHGYAWAGGVSSSFAGPSPSGSVAVLGNGTAALTVSSVTNPDGSLSLIETTGVGVGLPVEATPSWWCNASLGQSVHQSDSPGVGWIACSGPTSTNGWYFSTSDYGGPVIVVSGGKPANPRTWADISVWAISTTGMLGGSPAASCSFKNTLIYPATGYTVGTTYPSLRVWDGRQDRELCLVPPTPAFVVPKAVLSLLAANGTVYFSTFDAGTSSADWSGRVMQVDPVSGQITPLGVAFTAGEMPYALAWHMGRLWCGTNNGIGTVGKVYYFRPGVDTAWTLDHSLSTETLGGVDSLCSYSGKLYVGSDNAAGAFSKILVRDTAGTYTVSETGTGGTARINNGYLAMRVYQGNLYASFWNADTTAVAKIRKFDGASWTTVVTGATTTLKPFILLFGENNYLYAIGGGKLLAGVILSSATGAASPAWTNLTAQLPETTETLLPLFGTVII